MTNFPFSFSGRKCYLQPQKNISAKTIQTEVSKASDMGQPKPVQVNFDSWVASLTPAQQELLLSSLLKHTQSNRYLCI